MAPLRSRLAGVAAIAAIGLAAAACGQSAATAANTAPAPSGAAPLGGAPVDTMLQSAPAAADRVARLWLAGTLTRTDLPQTWDLTAVKFRSAYKHERWLAGYLPVPPIEPPNVVIDRLAPEKAFMHSGALGIRYKIYGHVPASTGSKILRYRNEAVAFLTRESGAWRISMFSLVYGPAGSKTM